MYKKNSFPHCHPTVTRFIGIHVLHPTMNRPHWQCQSRPFLNHRTAVGISYHQHHYNRHRWRQKLTLCRSCDPQYVIKHTDRIPKLLGNELKIYICFGGARSKKEAWMMDTGMWSGIGGQNRRSVVINLVITNQNLRNCVMFMKFHGTGPCSTWLDHMLHFLSTNSAPIPTIPISHVEKFSPINFTLPNFPGPDRNFSLTQRKKAQLPATGLKYWISVLAVVPGRERARFPHDEYSDLSSIHRVGPISRAFRCGASWRIFTHFPFQCSTFGFE